MSTTTRQVREAILTALRTIDGTGSYTWNLAGEAAVKGGKFARPPAAVPFACVWTGQVSEDNGTALTDFESVGTFFVLAWTPPKPKDPGARQGDAESMLDDIRRAIRASRRLGGLVRSITIAGQPHLDGAPQTPDMQSYGICAVAISATWVER